jgi:exopolysaccharide biosynthesis protein
MIFMVVAEGRKETSKGMLAEDLSRLMIELGAWDAMMFDGGASATLHTKKYTVTNNAKERNVFNGLAVFMTK